MTTATHLRRLSLPELDTIGRRLEEIAQEEEELRAKVTEQIQEFGFTPPRADKSKRLQAQAFQFTLSSSSTTEIRDAEVERIRDTCPDGLFAQLFVTVTKYKLTKSATTLLAGTLPEGAPRNLRMMFSRAVQVVEGSPRLRIEKLTETEP
jgi:hypothetical protein